VIASTTRRASALDGKRQPRSFAKRYWRKCDDTPTLGSIRVAVQVSLTLFKQKLGQSNVTSLVERVSRFTVILKNPNKRTKPVMGKIMKSLKDLPLVARRSITFDRGTEFVSWPHLQAEIGTQTWFCDPSSPWQKGTVENTNRRLRRWLPRKRDIRQCTDHDMKVICDRLNNTPRKCLGWKTPAEVFREKMLEEMR